MPFDRERYLSNQLTPSLGHGGVLRDVTVASVCIPDAYSAYIAYSAYSAYL